MSEPCYQQPTTRPAAAAARPPFPSSPALHGDPVTAYRDRREHVFAPFYRLPGAATGTGLSLSLVRQIARLHGGEAAVASDCGRSSCFRVTIPLLPLALSQRK